MLSTLEAGGCGDAGRSARLGVTEAAYSGGMTTDDTKNPKTPDGSTEVSSEEAERTEKLADGSQSDDSSPTEDDTASGGPAD